MRLRNVTHVDVGRALCGKSLGGERSFGEDGVVEQLDRGIECFDGLDIMDDGL